MKNTLINVALKLNTKTAQNKDISLLFPFT